MNERKKDKMKVKDLINDLSKFDPNDEVFIKTDWEAEGVFVAGKCATLTNQDELDYELDLICEAVNKPIPNQAVMIYSSFL